MARLARGIDADNDIEVTVDAGVLTIHAERREEHEETHRSEFRYGVLTRSVALSPKVDPAQVKASYGRGILQVSVPLTEARTESYRIAITKTA